MQTLGRITLLNPQKYKLFVGNGEGIAKNKHYLCRMGVLPV